jgi:hypothetical protein
MPTLKRHKCRAPVAFHAFMNTRCCLGAAALSIWTLFQIDPYNPIE